MPGYINVDLIKGSAHNDTNKTVDCIASATNVVSDDIIISGEDSRNLLVYVKFSLIEETNAMNVVLQDSADNGITWATVKTVAVATTKAVHTVTWLTKANTTDADYVVIEDTSGAKWAIYADKTGSTAAPTGAIYAAIPAANKGKADISGSTTAADVAAVFETSFDALTGFTALITTDDTAADGTMTFTQTKGGTVTAPVPKNEDDSGAGTIVGADTTPGAATLTYELENNVLDGTDTAMWPRSRVVVTTGVADTATMDNVFVSRRK